VPRIIAGTLRGQYLAGPKDDRTRPTSDKVREALFSRLDAWDALADARVLDLYAGIGTLALEAVSRGAASAVLVERHAATARRLRTAVGALGLGGTVRVDVGDARTWDGAGGPFDLVFADPPYEAPTAEVEELLRRLVAAGRLGPAAVVAVERSRRSDPLAWPEGLDDLGTKTYGETVVQFAETPPSADLPAGPDDLH
jgi:16S rRNA (guanine966-N2)-methyltransferase